MALVLFLFSCPCFTLLSWFFPVISKETNIILFYDNVASSSSSTFFSTSFSLPAPPTLLCLLTPHSPTNPQTPALLKPFTSPNSTHSFPPALSLRSLWIPNLHQMSHSMHSSYPEGPPTPSGAQFSPSPAPYHAPVCYK